MSISNQAPTLLLKYLEYVHNFPERASRDQFSGLGPIQQLENEMMERYRMPYAVGVPNATLGLWALALAADLHTGDEIITTPMTHPGTIAGALHQGCTLVLADIDPVTLALDPAKIKALITKDTKAILAVDTLGIPHDTEALRDLADDYGLLYFADAAESLGATIRGLPASSQAHAMVLSFTAGKPLYAGEGGMILTRNQSLYKRLIHLTQHPFRQSMEFPGAPVNAYGLNLRLNPLAAQVAHTTMKQAVDELKNHQLFCMALIRRLNNSGLVELIPFHHNVVKPSFFRLSAAWMHKPQLCKLLRSIRQKYPLKVRSMPFGLLTQNPMLMSQHRHQIKIPQPLTQAESQMKKRFCIRRFDPLEDTLESAFSPKEVLR